MRRKPTLFVLLLGAFLCGFCFRIGEETARAVPVNCNQWPCVDSYAWITNDKTVFSAEKSGTVTPDADSHTTQALLNFYSPATLGKLPQNPTGNNIQRFTWGEWYPQCTNNNKNPLPETCDPGGTASVDARPAQYRCSSNQ